PCSRLFLRRLRIRPPPSSTLFPYTTLFRSQWWDLARLEARSSVASLNSSDDIAESGFSWSHDLSQVKSGVLVKWREPLAERKWRPGVDLWQGSGRRRRRGAAPGPSPKSGGSNV